MSYSIDTSELRKLAIDLEWESSRVGAEAARAVKESANRVQSDARTRAPKGATGNLRRSIGVDFYGDGRSVGLTAVVGPTAYYGKFLEGGTVKMSPRPFMQPALDAEAPRLEEAIAAIAGGVLS